MRLARPTVREERWIAAAERHPALRVVLEQSGNAGTWKTTTWLARCLGVLLGLMATGLFAAVLAPLPSPWLFGGVVMVIVAEWLVALRRVLHSGVGEVVYLCGAIAIVVQILLWNRQGGHEEIGVALIAASMALVGWRLLNPWIGTLAVATLSLSIAMSSGSPFGNGIRELQSGMWCAALALIALVAGAREWQRPSASSLCDGVVVVMPWLAYAWLMVGSRSQGSPRDPVVLAGVLAFLLLYLGVGLVRRWHAPLVGALGLLVCTALELHQWVIWPMYWQLITAGVFLLITAFVADRMLRERGVGITARPFGDTTALDLMQVGASAHMAPSAGDPPPEAVMGQGGGFSGGGTSGSF